MLKIQTSFIATFCMYHFSSFHMQIDMRHVLNKPLRDSTACHSSYFFDRSLINSLIQNLLQGSTLKVLYYAIYGTILSLSKEF